MKITKEEGFNIFLTLAELKILEKILDDEVVKDETGDESEKFAYELHDQITDTTCDC